MGAAARVKRGSAGAVVLDYLRAQSDKLRALDPLVRGDAPDSVHQMRVTARRMRSALQTYRRVLDRAATRPVVEQLRWLGRELNDARDAEVIERYLITRVEGLPEELVLGPVSAQITRAMQRRRVDGQVRAVAALESDRYRQLHDSIDRLLADPPFTGRAHRRATRELPRDVAKAWRRTTARLADAQDAPEGAPRDEAIHETRKAAKRLRYAVELARPVVGKKAKRLRRDLKRMTTALGDHQDAVVARPVIRELAAAAHVEGGNGFTHGILHGEQRLQALLAEQRLPRVGRSIRRGKNVKWLRRA